MGLFGSKTAAEAQTVAKSLIQQPFDLNGLPLKNRFVMGPMTRCRADPKDSVPNDLMAEYYAQRAKYFGLCLTECSQISPLSNSFPGSGGIYNQEQAEGWKKVVDKVKNAEGNIILQIWHGGRAVPSEFIDGQLPIGPSPIAVSYKNSFSNTPHPIPKEMTKDDIKIVQEQFFKSAEFAKQAGFDGVELHGANGYLVDQFLRDGSNQRTDEYGGSIENRCKFALETIDTLSSVFPSNRVSIRLGATGRYNDMYDSDPNALMKYLLGELSKKDLQFVELKRHGMIDGGGIQEGDTDQKGRTLPDKQIPDYFKTLRGYYDGIIIGNDGLTPEIAEEEIKNGNFDLASFSYLSLSNPDLPYRYENKIEYAQNDMAIWFSPGEKGYTDFPLAEKK